MVIEDFKKDINHSLKEIQANTGKQLDALKEETQKSLKELQENTTKEAKEMSKTIQDIKMEIETIKKSQTGERKPRKKIRNHRHKHHQHNTRVKENSKGKKLLTQNIQEIQDTKRRLNLKIIGIEESEVPYLKGPGNTFNKIIEENFPNLKKEMPTTIQEAYRTPNRLDQKRNSS
jgi:chromosome segregation ATPase